MMLSVSDSLLVALASVVVPVLVVMNDEARLDVRVDSAGDAVGVMAVEAAGAEGGIKVGAGTVYEISSGVCIGYTEGLVFYGAATPKSLLASDKVLNCGAGSGFFGTSAIDYYAFAIDRVFSIANLVLFSKSCYGEEVAGGEISREDPEPRVDAFASSFADSSYILFGVFAASLALAITD
jgi:hypothetical protein